MRLKLNKGFSLFEVVIAVAILGVAAVFIFRALMTVFAGVRVGQNFTLASMLADTKMWELKEKIKQSGGTLFPEPGTETIQGRDFGWNYTVLPVDSNNDLYAVNLTISWPENNRLNEELTLATYIYKSP